MSRLPVSSFLISVLLGFFLLPSRAALPQYRVCLVLGDGIGQVFAFMYLVTVAYVGVVLRRVPLLIVLDEHYGSLKGWELGQVGLVRLGYGCQ